MKVRALLVATMLAVPMTLATAAPASAVWCGPEEGYGRCCGDSINKVWEKVFGSPLIYC